MVTKRQQKERERAFSSNLKPIKYNPGLSYKKMLIVKKENIIKSDLLCQNYQISSLCFPMLTEYYAEIIVTSQREKLLSLENFLSK